MRALVEASSEASYSATVPSRRLKSHDTDGKCYCGASSTACYPCSQSGMTSEPSTADGGVGLWIALLRASRASRSLSLASSEERPTPETSGPMLRESFARYDRPSRSWRTSQVSLLTNTDDEFLQSWPSQGLMRDGVVSRLPTAERPISGNDFGFWPTPQKHDAVPGNPERVGRYGTKHGGRNLNDWAAKWPTPRSSDGSHGGRVTPRKSRNGGNLIEAVAKAQFATPTKHGNYNRKGASPTSGDGLATQVGGTLNPPWVEWLMGWPIGWSGLEPLEMDKFRQWLSAHGAS